MGKYKYIVWDWNGTLIDDVRINFETINTLLRKRSLREMESLFEYRSLMSFPVKNFYERIGFDFENESYERVASEYIREYENRFYECELFEGAGETLRKINSLPAEQVIISACEREMLLKQTEYFGIDHLFAEIIGRDDIFGGEKAFLAERWLKKSGWKRDEVLFVGDMDHDFEVAAKAGCDCVLLSSGHCSRERLSFYTEQVRESISEIFDFVK